MNAASTCTNCGAAIAGGVRFCETCGQPVAMVAAPTPPAAMRVAVAAKPNPPASPQMANPPGALPMPVEEMTMLNPERVAPTALVQPAPAQLAAPAKPATGGAWAPLALILGILSFLASLGSPIYVLSFCVGSLVCGFIGRKSPRRTLAIIGAVLGVLGLLVNWVLVVMA